MKEKKIPRPLASSVLSVIYGRTLVKNRKGWLYKEDEPKHFWLLNGMLGYRLPVKRIRVTDAERTLPARNVKADGRKVLLEPDTRVSEHYQPALHHDQRRPMETIA